MCVWRWLYCIVIQHNRLNPFEDKEQAASWGVLLSCRAAIHWAFLAWGVLAGPWTEASVLQYLFTAKPSRCGNILLRTLISGLEFLPWAQVQHHTSAYHCSQKQTFYSHAQETGTTSWTESMWWTDHAFHRHLSTKVGGASPGVHRVPLLNARDEEITSETKPSIQHTLLG